MDTKRTENCMICGEELAYLTAAIATGIAMSVILKASPLTDYERRTANIKTSRALAAIAVNSGARCCKRSHAK